MDDHDGYVFHSHAVTSGLFGLPRHYHVASEPIPATQIRSDVSDMVMLTCQMRVTRTLDELQELLIHDEAKPLAAAMRDLKGLAQWLRARLYLWWKYGG